MAIREEMETVLDQINLTAFHAFICRSPICQRFAWINYLYLLRN